MKQLKTLTSQKNIKTIGAGTIWNVKKYRNRKYYLSLMAINDYITLDDMREHLKLGGVLKVVDKTTKMDITSQTIATINYFEIKRSWGAL